MVESTCKQVDWLENISNQEISKESFEDLYWDSTKQTLVGLYSQRPNGEPSETVTDIVNRVATAVAISELKYDLSPKEIVEISLEEALTVPRVIWWANVFRKCIGTQMFWANTPANINASPESSLMVLQYEAHGILDGQDPDSIWLKSDEYLRAWENRFDQQVCDSYTSHQMRMGELVSMLKGKGCLAACGVTFVEDSLHSIQEAARVEVIAAKNAMGMGINTSSIRPWNSLVSNGAAASGPDRFYHKTISMAVDAVAQGGRRGGALIELRNSDHPDILFFIEKKKLFPAPVFSQIVEEELKGESDKVVALERAAKRYADLHHKYMERQNYLKNTNVTVLAMPGFIDAVQRKDFYAANWAGKAWRKSLWDPRKPIMDDRGQQRVSTLTKEPMFEEYSVDLRRYPEALSQAKKKSNYQGVLMSYSDKEQRVGLQGHFYAPDIFDRICEGMRDSGEPGIFFWDLVNSANANAHEYDLITCNPCGEQSLPAGPSKNFEENKRFYMGVCNLSSLHAAHKDFWNEDGSFNFDSMNQIVKFQQRFMDNVTDVSWFPVPAQNLTARLERRNGGGFAGIAEYLSRLGLEFGSSLAREATEKLFRNYSGASLEASLALGQQRGTYPIWKGSEFHKRNLPVRNACMVNNAPTGTLAQAMQTSWGVDPHNGIVFSRKVRSRYVNFVAPGFQYLMEKHGAWPANEEDQNTLMQKIRENGKSCRGIDEVPLEVQNAFPIRVEVSPENYILHLAACFAGAEVCPFVFNSISNTCSIPADMGLDEIKNAVMLAYRTGVKDLTFYPDGSRLSQPVEQIAASEKSKANDLKSMLGMMSRRFIDSNAINGTTYKIRVGTVHGDVGTLHVILNTDEGSKGPIEVYSHLGKSGCYEGGILEAVGRLTSSFLQYAAQFGEEERSKAEEMVIKQLIGIESGTVAWNTFPGSKKAERITSPVDALAKVLRYHKQQKEESKQHDDIAVVVEYRDPVKLGKVAVHDIKAGPQCPKCHSYGMTKGDGCWICNDCGYSKCG